MVEYINKVTLQNQVKQQKIYGKFFFLKARSLNQIKNPIFAVALFKCQTRFLNFFQFQEH